jgi:hypothetical protein
MTRIRLFLASSAELSADREQFEIFINRKNKAWFDRGVFLDLVLWEDFLDALSRTRLQDEYNRAIRECDLFVLLFFTKVGPYTEEEFETAFGQFRATNKPFIFTYFKDAPINTGAAERKDLMSLLAFQEKLDSLGHFYTRYRNVDELKLKFNQQLEKLAESGFIRFHRDSAGTPAPGATGDRASLRGDGAIAQGGGTAVGARGISIGGNNRGDLNTGTQTRIETGGAYIGGNVETGGGDFTGRDQFVQGVPAPDLEPLFAPLLAAVARQAPADRQADARKQVLALKAELTRGKGADDGRMAGILDGLAAMVPGAIGTLVGIFASPILQGIAGPVTSYVLSKLKGP